MSMLASKQLEETGNQLLQLEQLGQPEQPEQLMLEEQSLEEAHKSLGEEKPTWMVVGEPEMLACR